MLCNVISPIMLEMSTEWWRRDASRLYELKALKIRNRNSEIHYRAGGAGGAGGGPRCLGAAQPALRAKYIAASMIIVVIFFIAVVCLQ